MIAPSQNARCLEGRIMGLLDMYMTLKTEKVLDLMMQSLSSLNVNYSNQASSHALEAVILFK